jgi:hypothetical protein
VIGGGLARRRQCIFGRVAVHPDPCPCSGELTQHHVRYRCEGGTRDPRNLVYVCEGHQHFVHSRETWGDESFEYLARDWKLKTRVTDLARGSPGGHQS